MLKCKHPSIHATRLIKYDMFSSRYCSIDKAIMYQINDVIDVLLHKILKMSSVSFFGSIFSTVIEYFENFILQTCRGVRKVFLRTFLPKSFRSVHAVTISLAVWTIIG